MASIVQKKTERHGSHAMGTSHDQLEVEMDVLLKAGLDITSLELWERGCEEHDTLPQQKIVEHNEQKSVAMKTA